MIECKCDKLGYGQCVICMDSFQNQGGIYDCTIAENLEYDPLTILRVCRYSEEKEIKAEN